MDPLHPRAVPTSGTRGPCPAGLVASTLRPTQALESALKQVCHSSVSKTKLHRHRKDEIYSVRKLRIIGNILYICVVRCGMILLIFKTHTSQAGVHKQHMVEVHFSTEPQNTCPASLAQTAGGEDCGIGHFQSGGDKAATQQARKFPDKVDCIPTAWLPFRVKTRQHRCSGQLLT